MSHLSMFACLTTFRLYYGKLHYNKQGINRESSKALHLKQQIGRLLILLVIINTFLTPLLFWADDIHFNSDEWVTHAKYHLVWQGSMVMLFNGIAFFLVLFAWRYHRQIPLITAGIPAVTWFAFIISAYLIMPALGFESEEVFPHHNIVNGVDTDNVLVVFTFAVTLVGYWLSRRPQGSQDPE